MDVRAIHEELVTEFAGSADPISPSGVRSEHLLESAVARQSAGYGARLKYDSAHGNAATLAYGLCMNHPFYNGNKRTSLVAMLCHLDRNDWTFEETVQQGELYALMLKIAAHKVVDSSAANPPSDAEVESIAKWIRRRTRKIVRGERIVTFRELKTILESFGFAFEDLRNNSMDLVRHAQQTTWFGLRRTTKKDRFMRMPYPGGGEVVSKSLLREIRERCGLDEHHGCDAQVFYGKTRPPDFFIAKYRKTLARLARV